MASPALRTTPLEEQPIRAAEASGGTSCEPVYQAIKKVILNLKFRGSLLDYGAGVGELTVRLHQLERFERITGADSRPRPKNLRSEIGWFAADLNRPIPCAPEAHDGVVAAEVIEHLENRREV